MMLGPLSAPSSPPETPVPTKWTPCSRNSRSRRRVSAKCALPPSMMTSPGSKRGVNSAITASVASPAFTMTTRRRGLSRAATKSSALSVAMKSPSSPNSSTSSWVRAAVRLCTATVYPLRAKFRARLRPMTASPVTPICAVLLIAALPASGFVVFGSSADHHDGTDHRAYEVQAIADWEAVMVSPMSPGWSSALCGTSVRSVRSAVRGRHIQARPFVFKRFTVPR